MNRIWLRRAGLAVGVVVGVAVVALVLVLLAPGVIGAEGTYVVQSDSMSPAINAGDMIVVSAVGTEQVHVGDVITYQTDTAADSSRPERVTHRVVEIVQTDDGQRFRTAGDANEEPDPYLVAPNEVIGTQWFTVPLVGWAIAFTSSDIGILLLVVVPSLALIVSEAYALYGEYRRTQ